MGHKLQMYENLRDMLEKEVKDIEKKGDLDVQSLDHLYKLMAAIKNTDKRMECIKEEEGGMSNGMSMRGGMSNNSYGNRRSYDGRSYEGNSNMMMPHMSYDRSYDGMSNDGMSNDGMSNARRGRDGDGDGRYNESRDNFRNSQDRGRESYENSYGYSRDASKKKMVQKLETLMDDTMSEHERQAIMDCINKIK